MAAKNWRDGHQRRNVESGAAWMKKGIRKWRIKTAAT